MGPECAWVSFLGPPSGPETRPPKWDENWSPGWEDKAARQINQKLGARSTTPKTKIRRFRNCAHGAGGKFCALAAAGMKKAAQKIAQKTKPETAHFAGQSGTLLQSINGAVASKMFARTLLRRCRALQKPVLQTIRSCYLPDGILAILFGRIVLKPDG